MGVDREQEIALGEELAPCVCGMGTFENTSTYRWLKLVPCVCGIGDDWGRCELNATVRDRSSLAAAFWRSLAPGHDHPNAVWRSQS